MSDYSRSRFARGNALSAAIGAALLLYFGFGVDMTGASGSFLYDRSVDACTWTMKIGGIAMAVIAAASVAGIARILVVDAAVTVAIGAVFIACGGIWLTSQQDWQGALFIVFGAMFVSSGRHSWQAYRRGSAESDESAPPPAETVRPAHPAEVHPDVLPQPDEPPPAEGYLAALAREKKQSPRADHE